jgi:hypothetical protein
MTAYQFRNLARCAAARLREAARVRDVADSEWRPVVQLLLLAASAGDREIAAHGFTIV